MDDSFVIPSYAQHYLFFKSIVLNDRKCWLANVQPLIRGVWIYKINSLLITRYDSLDEEPVKWIFLQFFEDIITTLSVFLTQFMTHESWGISRRQFTFTFKCKCLRIADFDGPNRTANFRVLAVGLLSTVSSRAAEFIIDGRPEPFFLNRLMSPSENFLNQICAVQMVIVFSLPERW